MKTPIVIPANADLEKNTSVALLPATRSLTGTMPKHEVVSHEFVTDWQLNAPDTLDKKLFPNMCRRVVTLGTSVLDVYLHGKAEAYGSGELRFETATSRFAVQCVGEPPVWGGKGLAVADLAAFADVPEAKTFPGGGVTHSTKQLVEYHRESRINFAISAIDTNHSSPQVATVFAKLGVEYTSLGLASAAINLVLSDAHIPPRRLVLRSPALPSASLGGKANTLELLLGPETIALLLNSPKSIEAAAYAVARAKSMGIPIYSVLTPSLPIPFRLERLFSSNETCVCNLSEFAEIVEKLGLVCPVDENQSSVAAVAQAISEVKHLKPCANICVTIGELGCVAADSASGVVCHIGLTTSARDKVRLCLKPERINGSGDRFFAVFATEHVRFQGRSTENSLSLHAARRACLEVVRSYNKHLNPTDDWFGVRIFSGRN